MTDKTELHVFHNDHEWYVAATAADALAEWVEFGGGSPGELDPDDWEQWEDSRKLTIVDSDGVPIVKTCREWADESGPGFLCAEDY
jgi:hypothetical protein